MSSGLFFLYLLIEITNHTKIILDVSINLELESSSVGSIEQQVIPRLSVELKLETIQIIAQVGMIFPYLTRRGYKQEI